jgi:cobalt-zinc-cadmium efflux system outer membrane protein
MKYWPFILIIALVAGCARFKAQPLSPDQTAAQFESRRLNDPGLRSFLEKNLGRSLAWPQTNWDFPELTLVAFYFHPDLEVARAQWLVAQGGVKTAGARPNPSVTVDPAYDTQIPGNFSPWLIPVSFDLTIETAGKRGKRIAEAEKNAESARFNFLQAAWKIRSDVRGSLQDLLLSRRRVALLQEQLNSQKEIVNMLQQRVNAGEISRPELTVARIALNHSQLDLSAARTAATDAHSHLAQALGLTVAALDGEVLKPDNGPFDIGQLTSAKAHGIALRSRADILAALADYAAAEDDLRLQVAKQYPDLHLGPGYAWNNGNAGDNEWSLGATLELPLLDQNQGPIAEAEANRNLAAAKFMALQAQVISDIDRAVADYRIAREQLQTGNQLFADEQQQQKSAGEQFEAGESDRLDSLNAHLELSNARIARLDNEASLETARAALEDALQQPADSIAAIIEKLPAETSAMTNQTPSPTPKKSQP